MRRIPSLRTLRGLTLLEVALSAAILGGVVAGMLVARARARDAFHASQEMMISTALCASKVQEIRAGLVDVGDGECSGRPGYRWSARGSSGDTPSGLEGYEVEITPPAHPEKSRVTVTLWLPTKAVSEDGEK